MFTFCYACSNTFVISSVLHTSASVLNGTAHSCKVLTNKVPDTQNLKLELIFESK